ncbi:thiamine-phosphate kinase [Gilvimarinus sp. SDUM040013]|uniref:Thiamine-monophosphate kinase n=1 Tax=Gilvimarinus gilvus TaxID=3058038 RepID=A0ABU4S0W9_9GAMM|nr:thiamine-phosphate kinase [Gilvimarinus sp. SDUM040013]MDO3387220.1 thiamine-phosphate kinase [Gilvimarinus sp. SDUM040013]MDX6850783.1 thiamine-phosphate kinase [Gilvimarinus sp. SDUM040013]
MAGGEFELINHYFKPAPEDLVADDVVLGIGDDAALVQPPTGELLAVATDTLVADVHFPADADAALIAERSMRVNLSDLAAMGAEPRWFTLALTLPGDWDGEKRQHWVAGFSRALKSCANTFGCTLIGGDTTRGPLSVGIQMLGSVPASQALRRDGAGLDDFVLVTGVLGDAAAALTVLDEPASDRNDYLRGRYYKPTPRIAEGKYLRGIASSAQDISDGLLADLGHICFASDVAAELDLAQLPFSEVLAEQPQAEAIEHAIAGGDDYELVFTVPPENMPELAMLQAAGKVQATVIGRIVSGAGVHCELDGAPYYSNATGYKHF